MRWSKYNRLFTDVTRGNFIYNSQSNSLFELDNFHFDVLNKMKHQEEYLDIDFSLDFFRLLREKLVFIEPSEYLTFTEQKKTERKKLVDDCSKLQLTICPTLACNFRCSYCFENSQKLPKIMSDDVILKLVDFIKSFQNAKNLSICWFGGEPTMAFDIIEKITDSIKQLNIYFEDASIITNGYLVNEEKIKKLNALNIKSIQITIDGLKEMHDSRRYRAGKKPTFERIIQNIENLLSSDYKGTCSIRVNIDKANYEEYGELKSFLNDKFKSPRLTIYPGRVVTLETHNCNSCNLNSDEWTDFALKLFEVSPNSDASLFPTNNNNNVCAANRKNSFVIGPCGEIYKCWEDVGKFNLVVGSLFEQELITNKRLVEQYVDGTNPYTDAECLDCYYLPICTGGCSNRRLRKKIFNQNQAEYCTIYKQNLEKYLMTYYDDFLVREFFTAFSDDKFVYKPIGYRLITQT